MPKYNPIFVPKWVMEMIEKCPTPCDSLYGRLPLLMHWRTTDYMKKELFVNIHNFHVLEHVQQSIAYAEKMIGGIDSNPLVARLGVSKHIRNEVVLTITTDVDRPDACAILILRVDDDGVITQLVRIDTNLDANNRI